MKILIVHQYFKTPEEGFGIRTFHIANAFAHRGHEVIVLSGHASKTGLHPFNGYQVNYFKIPYANNFGFVKRLFAFALFVIACKKYLALKHDFDLAYVLTTPLSTGFIALHLWKKYKIPYAFEVGDLWPEVPIQLGLIPNRYIQKWLYQFEKKVYNRAEFLIGLSPPIQDYLAKCVPNNKPVHVATNMCDLSLFQPSYYAGQSFSAESPFRILYAGTFGYANGLHTIVDIAHKCQEENLPVQFVFMGDGSTKQSIANSLLGLNNVKMTGTGGLPEVQEQMNRSHAILISYLDVPVLNTGCPNKLFDGLASGKIILTNFDGWIQELIRNNQCGFSFPPTDPARFIQKLNRLLAEPEVVINYQQNARLLAENEFGTENINSKLIRYLGL